MITIMIGEAATGKTTKALKMVGTKKHLWITRPILRTSQLLAKGVEVVVFDGMLWNENSVNIVNEFLKRENIPDVIFIFQSVYEMRRVIK